LPLGVISAQLCHAAGFSANLSSSTHGHPLPLDTRAVVLSVANEAKLLALERDLQAAAIPHWPVREPDSPYSGQLMAIGVLPCQRSLVKSILGGLSLYGREK